MAHRAALLLLALAAPATLIASCVDAAVSPWLVALGSAAFPAALIALGASRNGRLGPLRAPLLLLGLVIGGVLLALLALPDGGPDAGSLPLGTALLLFVLVPVPLVLVGWAHAATFERWFLRDEDLERIRRLRRPQGTD